MEKKYLLINIVIALVMLNDPVALAATSDLPADQAAIQAVLDQQTIDEQAVCARGKDYMAAFLVAFRENSVVYQRAFQAGMADATSGQYRAPTGQVAMVAYQRGYEHEMTNTHQSQDDGNQNDITVDEKTVEGENEIAGGTTGKSKVNDFPPAPADVLPVAPGPAQNKFIHRLAKVAQRVGNEYDLYPSVIIAQAALESNWGQSGLGQAPYHNLFGIKGYFAGRSTLQPTTEFKDGHQIAIKDQFKWYDNDYQALCDYAQTLTVPLYANVHRQVAPTYRDATRALVGRYATDPQYDVKLNAIIDSYHLTKYDHGRPNSRPVKPVSQVLTATPIDDFSPAQHPRRTRKKHHLSAIVPIVGGAGSAGVISLIRRCGIFK